MDQEEMSCCKVRCCVLEEINRCVRGVSLEALKEAAGRFDRGGRIFCDGAGRSRLQAEGFAMRLTQMGFRASVVGEVTAPAITERALLFIVSGTGETPILVNHAKKAKRLGAGVVLLTASKESSLSGLSDEIILLEAAVKNNASDCSVQPMGSLFEQSAGILCDLLVLLLMKKYGISSREMYENHSNLE